jgi:GNAT superfamily N-acetyltransferase
MSGAAVHFDLPETAPYPFEFVASQFPRLGTPGNEHVRQRILAVVVKFPNRDQPLWTTTDALLSRDDDGNLVGVLIYYPEGFTAFGCYEIEKPGNLTIYVHPDRRRQGIATRLNEEAERRWTLPTGQQNYTDDGRAFARSLGYER